MLKKVVQHRPWTVAYVSVVTGTAALVQILLAVIK